MPAMGKSVLKLPSLSKIVNGTKRKTSTRSTASTTTITVLDGSILDFPQHQAVEFVDEDEGEAIEVFVNRHKNGFNRFLLERSDSISSVLAVAPDDAHDTGSEGSVEVKVENGGKEINVTRIDSSLLASTTRNHPIDRGVDKGQVLSNSHSLNGNKVHLHGAPRDQTPLLAQKVSRAPPSSTRGSSPTRPTAIDVDSGLAVPIAKPIPTRKPSRAITITAIDVDTGEEIPINSNIRKKRQFGGQQRKKLEDFDDEEDEEEEVVEEFFTAREVEAPKLPPAGPTILRGSSDESNNNGSRVTFADEHGDNIETHRKIPAKAPDQDPGAEMVSSDDFEENVPCVESPKPSTSTTRPITTSPLFSPDLSSMIVLLMCPTTKQFELVTVHFPQETKTPISSVLSKIPKLATFDLLQKQVYTGFCRPKDGLELINAMNVSDLVGEGEILIGIPKGMNGCQCREMAQPILTDKKLLRLINRLKRSCRASPNVNSRGHSDEAKTLSTNYTFRPWKSIQRVLIISYTFIVILLIIRNIPLEHRERYLIHIMQFCNSTLRFLQDRGESIRNIASCHGNSSLTASNVARPWAKDSASLLAKSLSDLSVRLDLFADCLGVVAEMDGRMGDVGRCFVGR